MVSIVVKKIKGKEYIYLVDSIRKNKKIIQKTIKYIGAKRPVPNEEFECMKFSYKKKDWILNDFKDCLSYQDHNELKEASDFYSNYLSKLDKVSKEKEKFLSVFISNSNAIEGSTLTVKETFDFLFKDAVPRNHTKKELNMASNLFEAWKYLENNYKEFPSKNHLFQLYKLVNKGVEEEETLGKYKKNQNYVGNSYTTSHLFVEEKMNQLFFWMKKALKKIDDFETAFQSHAQFEIIHPFIDGNGRVGRLLMNWILMMKSLQPLAIHSKKRSVYINSLDNSRQGSLKDICKFCFNEYKEQYKFA